MLEEKDTLEKQMADLKNLHLEKSLNRQKIKAPS